MKGKKIFLLLGIFLILSVCFFGCSSEGDNDKQAKETNGAVLESSLPDIDAFATGTMVPETMNPSDAVTDVIFGEQTSTPTFVSDNLSTEAPTDNILSTDGFVGEVSTSTPAPTSTPDFTGKPIFTSTPAPTSAQSTGSIIATAQPTKTPVEFDGSKVEIGDCVLFGSYEQDNDLNNGKEQIEWIVLDVKDNKALLISKYSLDCQIYNESVENIVWADSSLRKWLNEDFYKAAFSSKDKGVIVSTSTGAEGDNGSVSDNVFLLSIDEASNYFKSDAERACVSTEYAVARGATNESGFCFWWLRSPGKMEECVAFVFNLGYVFDYGRVANLGDCGVRPAVWVNMK